MNVIYGLIYEENERLKQLVLIYEGKLKGPLDKEQKDRYQGMLERVKLSLFELEPLLNIVKDSLTPPKAPLTSSALQQITLVKLLLTSLK